MFLHPSQEQFYMHTNRRAVVESSVYVWAYREEFRKEYWNEVETDENGTFTISVLPGGKYEVGAILSQELRELAVWIL